MTLKPTPNSPVMPRGTTARRATLSGASASAPDTFLCRFEARRRVAQKGRIRRVVVDAALCASIFVICGGCLLIGWVSS